MKKLAIVLLSVVTVLAFAVTAFALHEVKATEYTAGAVKSKSQVELGGSIRARGEITRNTSDFDKNETDDKKQAFDQRVRLHLKADVSKNTRGFVELESGNSDTKDTWTWGSGSNEKRGDMRIRQAYIAHQGSGLLGTMAGIKVGHLLAALGNNLFFDHSKFGEDGIVLWANVGGGEIAWTLLKIDEDGSNDQDDTDAHILSYERPLGNMYFSGDLTYLRSKYRGTYDEGTKLWNLGLRGSTDVSGIKLMGDIEIQAGTDKEDSSGDQMKHEGYAFMIGAETKVNDVSLRLKGAYGSGDADWSDEKDTTFMTFLSDQQNYTYVYEYRTVGAEGSKNSGLANTWYINAGATAKATPDITLSGDIYFLRAAKKLYDGFYTDSRKIGWEVDGKAEYKIDNNLVYYVEGGYLFADDFFKNFSSDNKVTDNAWAIRHGINLTF